MNDPTFDVVALLIWLGAGVVVIGLALVAGVVVVYRRTRLDLPTNYRLPDDKRHEQLVDLLRAGTKEGRRARVSQLRKALGVSWREVNYAISHLEKDGSVTVSRQDGLWDALFAPYSVMLSYKARERLGDGPVGIGDIIVLAGQDAEVAVINGNVTVDARVFLNAVRERIDDPATSQEDKGRLRALLDAAGRLGEGVVAEILAAWLAKQVPGAD